MSKASRLFQSLQKTRAFQVAGLFVLLVFVFLGLRHYLREDLIRQKSYSQQFLDRHQKLLRLTLSGDEKYRVFSPLSDIDPKLIQSFLSKEDQYFYYHWGFNPISLFRATYQTYIAKSFRQGGSTLTMQVVRLLYPETTKSISGKFFQILQAFKVELLYSKDEILTAYLNWTPYGSNIEGVRAACLIYFDKSCQKLTQQEIDFLIQIPQNPNRFLSQALQNKKKLVFKSPHFIESLIQRGTSEKTVTTTLDLKLDQEVQKLAKNYFESLKKFGIKNYSVVVADSNKGEILSYIGSADYFNSEIKGQIDANRTLKSPGSTLKPFIYALGLQEGLIHEKSLMKDTRMSFSGIDPENFDEQFLGPLPADQALILSRNLPAVSLSMRLKNPSLYDFLKDKSSLKFKDEKYYGLSLALGGVEFSMLDLVRLYAALGQLGEYRDLKWTLEKMKDQSPAKNILNAEAVYILMQMLQKNPRTESTTLTDLTQNQLPVAWKTGTSKSYKDAWTIGLVGSLVVGVWLGDNDKEINPALVGRQVAAPLFFQIYDLIQNSKSLPYRQENPKWKNRLGLNLKSVHICSLSKKIITENCGHHSEEALFIPAISPIESCQIHRKIYIDTKTQERSCSPVIGQAQQKAEIIEVWPDDLLELYRQSGIRKMALSEKKFSCRSLDQNQSELQITSPQEHLQYLLSPQINKSNGKTQYQVKIALKAISESDSQYLDWYVNKNYIGRAAKNEPLFFTTEAPGFYFVSVTDSLGRQQSTQFQVKLTEF